MPIKRYTLRSAAWLRCFDFLFLTAVWPCLLLCCITLLRCFHYYFITLDLIIMAGVVVQCEGTSSSAVQNRRSAILKLDSYLVNEERDTSITAVVTSMRYLKCLDYIINQHMNITSLNTLRRMKPSPQSTDFELWSNNIEKAATTVSNAFIHEITALEDLFQREVQQRVPTTFKSTPIALWKRYTIVVSRKRKFEVN